MEPLSPGPWKRDSVCERKKNCYTQHPPPPPPHTHTQHTPCPLLPVGTVVMCGVRACVCLYGWGGGGGEGGRLLGVSKSHSYLSTSAVAASPTTFACLSRQASSLHASSLTIIPPPSHRISAAHPSSFSLSLSSFLTSLCPTQFLSKSILILLEAVCRKNPLSALPSSASSALFPPLS